MGGTSAVCEAMPDYYRALADAYPPRRSDSVTVTLTWSAIEEDPAQGAYPIALTRDDLEEEGGFLGSVGLIKEDRGARERALALAEAWDVDACKPGDPDLADWWEDREAYVLGDGEAVIDAVGEDGSMAVDAQAPILDYEGAEVGDLSASADLERCELDETDNYVLVWF